MKTLYIFLLLTISVSAQQKIQVFFDFNKDIPTAVSSTDFHSWLKQNPEIEVLALHGYCDSIDGKSYNKDLAMRRISSVIEILKQQNVGITESVVMKPIGEDFKASNDNPENRRVDVFYKSIGERKKSAEIKNRQTEEYLSSKNKREILNGKKGDLVQIHNIHFYLNSEIVVPESETVLDDLYDIMEKYPELKIAIHGHICCNSNPNDTKLSYRRAMYIFNYLRESGIAMNRLSYKGFGSANPIHRIPEKNAMEKQANRRVEILIVERTKNRI